MSCEASSSVSSPHGPVRLLTIPLADMAEHWDVAVNLLAGSLVGAWLGASWATRMQTRALHQVLAGLLVGIAIVLYASHQGEMTAIGLEGPALVAAGTAARRVGQVVRPAVDHDRWPGDTAQTLVVGGPAGSGLFVRRSLHWLSMMQVGSRNRASSRVRPTAVPRRTAASPTRC